MLKTQEKNKKINYLLLLLFILKFLKIKLNKTKHFIFIF